MAYPSITFTAIIALLILYQTSYCKGFSPAQAHTHHEKTCRIPRASLGHSETSHVRLQEDTVQGVTLKIAMDEQGAIADLANQVVGRFTCEESLDLVHRLRHESQAVLVGRRTVEQDDCSLTIRRGIESQEQPLRVVLDPHRRLLVQNYQIAQDGHPTAIYHGYHAPPETPEDGQARITPDEHFANVIHVGLPMMIDEDDKLNTNGLAKATLSVGQVVQHLREEMGIQHLMVEGGAETARRFLKDTALVDRVILIHAPMSFAQPLLSHITPTLLRSAGLVLLGEGMVGVDRVEYWSRNGASWPKLPYSAWP